jgi:hypothetical protein
MNDDAERDALASLTFTPTSGEAAEADEAAQQKAADEAAKAEALEKVAASTCRKVLIGLGKFGREKLAKTLPTIREEWPDSIFEGPADAAMPLISAHLQRLMLAAGSNEKLLMFGFSLVPMALGVMAAIEKDARTIDVPARQVETETHAPD